MLEHFTPPRSLSPQNLAVPLIEENKQDPYPKGDVDAEPEFYKDRLSTDEALYSLLTRQKIEEKH
jgi:hypothetical protein